jgi:penicillin-binding protein 2
MQILDIKEGLVEYKTKFRWAVIIYCIFFLVLLLNFFILQIIEGDRYSELSSITHIGQERIPARRGLIKDKYGVILAENIENIILTAIPHFMKDPDNETALISSLLNISGEEKKGMLSEIYERKNGIKRFEKIILKKSLISGRCPYDGFQLNYDAAADFFICPECGMKFKDERTIIMHHLHELPGVMLETRLKRHYPIGSLTGHITGYMNEVNAAEILKGKGKYRLGDLIGRLGVESSSEKLLRGTDGEEYFIKDSRGVRVDLSEKQLPASLRNFTSSQPVSGYNVILTIDLELQQTAYELLSGYYSGAIVVMDVNTGQILAMYSKPAIDPNTLKAISGQEEETRKISIFSPVLNKAVTAYPPGSVFKLVTAIAGLQEGIITKDSEFYCPGIFEYKGRSFKCYNRGGHGKVNFIDSLMFSCDIYYYKLGDMLGMDTLEMYAKDIFGFGKKTGIELPESAGLIPSVEWHMKHSPHGFQPGFVLNTAVGQGDVKVTPLQVARLYSSLFNGGKILKPRIISQIEDIDGNIIKKIETEIEHKYDIADEDREAIIKGLLLTVNDRDGTAFKARSAQFVFGGKTGTAEAAEIRSDVDPRLNEWFKQDHAWFAGFAPYPNPEVVIVVFIEHGGLGGNVAAPVAKKMVEKYYRDVLQFQSIIQFSTE